MSVSSFLVALDESWRMKELIELTLFLAAHVQFSSSNWSTRWLIVDKVSSEVTMRNFDCFFNCFPIEMKQADLST